MISKRVSRLITAAVFALFAVYFVLNANKFKPLLHINPWLLIVIAAANVLFIVLNGLFIKFILQPFNKFISIAESTYVSLISSVGNFFAPVGAGFGFRAVYLKKKHGLPYSEFISTLSGNYIIVFLVNSFVALVALYMLRDTASSEYNVLVFLFLSIFVGSLVLSLVKLPESASKHAKNHKYIKAIVDLLVNVTRGWNQITSNKKLMLRLIGIAAIGFVVSIIMAKLEIVALHFTIGFAQLLLFSVLGTLSLFVNITPANLGIKEAIYIFSAKVIGLSISQILLISLVDRGVLFIVLTLLWAIFVRRKQNPLTEDV